jgi:hypothetical protein
MDDGDEITSTTVDTLGLSPLEALEASAQSQAPEVQPTAEKPVEGQTQADAKGEQEKQEKRDRVQDRINKLTRAKEEMRERAERAEAALRSLQAQAPQRSAYATDLDFQAATVAHAARVGTIHAAKDQAEIGLSETVSQENAERDQAFQESVAEALRDMPDWHAVVSSSTVAVSDAALEAIKESAVGARIVYQLAKNPAQAQHIARMAPNSQVREILRMEHTLGTAQAPRTITKAPAPLEPVRSSQLSPDEEMKEWERRENERERKRRMGQ